MTANYVWELPFGNNAFFGGWQLSGITYARTGRAINVTISRSAGLLPDQNSISIQRPDLLSGVSIEGNRDGDRGFINPAAFGLPARLVYGNAPRKAARDTGLFLKPEQARIGAFRGNCGFSGRCIEYRLQANDIELRDEEHKKHKPIEVFSLCFLCS